MIIFFLNNKKDAIIDLLFNYVLHFGTCLTLRSSHFSYGVRVFLLQSFSMLNLSLEYQAIGSCNTLIAEVRLSA